ncbi:MAG: hypothetical protein JNK04_15895, partial [Myxococcales bacterium]|nr:hypothetical protein [Myxococcales bacterium]
MCRRGLCWTLIATLQLLACSSPPTAPPDERSPSEPQQSVTAPSPPTAEPIETAASADVAAAPSMSAAQLPRSGSPLPTYESYFRPSHHPTPQAGKDGYFLLHDFSRRAGGGSSLNGLEVEGLVARFPHPEAKAGTTCRANDPNEPQKKVQESFATAIAGSFSAAGAKEMAFLIDYCPTGLGVPRTRRVIVLDG